MGISRKTKPVTSGTPSPVPILIMQETAKPFLPPNTPPYNNFSNGNGGIRLTTEAQQITVLQLLILLAQELARLKKPLTGETGAAVSVIEHALRLMRQIERPTLGN